MFDLAILIQIWRFSDLTATMSLRFTIDMATLLRNHKMYWVNNGRRYLVTVLIALSLLGFASVLKAGMVVVVKDHSIKIDESGTVVVFSFKTSRPVSPISSIYSLQVQEDDEWKELECDWQGDGTETGSGDEYFIFKCEVPCELEGTQIYRFFCISDPYEPGIDPYEVHQEPVACSLTSTEPEKEPNPVEVKDASVITITDASVADRDAGEARSDSAIDSDPGDTSVRHDASISLNNSTAGSASEVEGERDASDKGDSRKSSSWDCGCSVRSSRSPSVGLVTLGLIMFFLFRRRRKRERELY